MRRRTLAIFVSSLLALVGSTFIGQGGAGSEPAGRPCKATEDQLRALDGYALFEGIFFHVGPAATLAYTPARSRCIQLDAPAPTAAALLNAIRQTVEPNFFTLFAQDLRSGDPETVDAAIKRGADLIRAASSPPASEDGYALHHEEPYEYYYMYYYEGVAAVVMAYYYIAYYIEYNTYAHYYEWYGPESVAPTDLTAERWIAHLTTTLG